MSKSVPYGRDALNNAALIVCKVSHVTRNSPASMRSALCLTHLPVVRSLLLQRAVVTGVTLSGTRCIYGCLHRTVARAKMMLFVKETVV
jgi:predicted metal-binding protein